MTDDDLELDSDAIVEMYCLQNLARMTEAAAASDSTRAEAVRAHEAFMRSEAL